MTRHKKPEDRIEEILDATADEIHDNGYAALTMDAISRRTALSKGSLYRFFKNKQEAVTALTEQMWTDYFNFTNEQVLQWNLPIRESLLRVILNTHFETKNDVRRSNIWVQLLPETARDQEFKDMKKRHTDRIQQKFISLILALVRRDHLTLNPHALDRLHVMLDVGNMIMAGFVIEHFSGMPQDDLRKRVIWYLDKMVDELLEEQA